MSFIAYVKKELNIAALIVLFGFAGNVLAYVYKAAYFFYFQIPVSMINYTFFEVILFSIGPIVIGLLFAYSYWITQAPENELAKIKAKYHLKKRIRPVNIFLVVLGCIPIVFVQWYITKNIMMIPITSIIGLGILSTISFLLKDNFKANGRPEKEKKIKREEKRYQNDIKAYWAEKVNAMKENEIDAEQMKKIAMDEIASANTEFGQFKSGLKKKAKSLQVGIIRNLHIRSIVFYDVFREDKCGI